MRPALQKWSGWIASVVLALALCGAVAWYEKGAMGYNLLHLLCDGFFVAGVALAGVGLLVWIANLGAFNALGYTKYLVRRKWFSSNKKFEERLSYLEYVQLYGEKEKRRPNCAIATGAVCIVIAFAVLLWS